MSLSFSGKITSIFDSRENIENNLKLLVHFIPLDQNQFRIIVFITSSFVELARFVSSEHKVVDAGAEYGPSALSTFPPKLSKLITYQFRMLPAIWTRQILIIVALGRVQCTRHLALIRRLTFGSSDSLDS